MEDIETTHKDEKVKKKNYWVGIVFLIALVIFTFYFLLKDQDLNKLIKTINTVNPIYIGCGLLAVFIFILCEALSFKIVLKTFKQKISFIRSLKYSFVGFFFSSITPAEPVQIYYMNKDDINMSFSSLTVLIVIVIYQITMVLYAALAFLINPTFIIAKASSIWILLIYGFTINIIIIIFILTAIFSKSLVFKIVNFIVKFLHKIRIVKNIDKANNYFKHQIDEYKQSVLVLKKNPVAIFKVILLTIIQLTAMYSVPFFVYKSFGLSAFSAMNIISLQSILTISVSSLPLPGAVGATEGSFMMLYKTFFTSSTITSAMLLSRGISFYIFLLISGTVVIVAQIISNRKNKDIEK